jgi:hypothetical protein
MPKGRIRSSVLFPVGGRVTVRKKSIGTFAEIGDEGIVATEPYDWYISPGAGPRLCVVLEIEGLCKQVRTKDLKAIMKGGLPA